MKEKILDTFYNSVLPNIVKGDLTIDGIIYDVHFNVSIFENSKFTYFGDIYDEKAPTLVIKNINTFSDAIADFVLDMLNEDLEWKKPYFDIADLNEKVRYFLSSMWINMTSTDFEEPEKYIRRYISFLSDETFKNLNVKTDYIEGLDNHYIQIENIEDKNCSETPYVLRIKISDDNNNHFYLPDVKYAIEEKFGEKTVYIYAIQYNYKMKTQNDNVKSNTNKINRLLYKINQDLPESELNKKMQTQEYYNADENIIDVTPSTIISLITSLSLFDNYDIKKVIIPCGFPVRWNAQCLKYDRKIKKQSVGLSNSVVDKIIEDYEEEQDRIGRNIIDKMIRNFRRLEYHFNGIKISSFPYDVDSFMRVDLNDIYAYNENHMLNSIFENVNNICNKKTKK
jgi:hypothetical protein